MLQSRTPLRPERGARTRRRRAPLRPRPQHRLPKPKASARAGKPRHRGGAKSDHQSGPNADIKGGPHLVDKHRPSRRSEATPRWPWTRTRLRVPLVVDGDFAASYRFSKRCGVREDYWPTEVRKQRPGVALLLETGDRLTRGHTLANLGRRPIATAKES
jgi:hypothetical protein